MHKRISAVVSALLLLTSLLALAQTLALTDFESQSLVDSYAPYDAQTDYLEPMSFGSGEQRARIWYEAGTDSDRFAQLTADPMNSTNTVLHYWVQNAVVPDGSGTKGRVQMGGPALKSLQHTVAWETFRMYLHSDIGYLNSYLGASGYQGLTIAELWMADSPTGAKSFRIPIKIFKDSTPGQDIYFQISGDRKPLWFSESGSWTWVWGADNKTFSIPIGEWMDIRIAYRKGAASTGRVTLEVKRASDSTFQCVINVTNVTRHPDRAQNLQEWQPLKLYARHPMIDHIKAQGGAAQIYWDDLQIGNAFPAPGSTCP